MDNSSLPKIRSRRDYLRHSNLHVTNKYLQATPNRTRLAQDKLVDAILPAGAAGETINPHPVKSFARRDSCQELPMGRFLYL
jgi:hypothetical protein